MSRASRCCAPTRQTMRSRCARSRSRGAELRFERTLLLTDAIPAASARAARHLGIRHRAARLARRLFASRAEIAAGARRRRRMCCSCNGMATSSTRRVGTRVPRLRLHRREVVLARRRHARRQRRLLAALAQAARSAAGSAHRARRSRGRDHRPRLSAAARARVRDSLRGRGAGRPLRVRSRVSDRASRSAFTASSTSAACCAGRACDARADVLRRDRALAAARQLLRNCIALGQWAAAAAIAQANARGGARGRRSARAARACRTAWRAVRRWAATIRVPAAAASATSSVTGPWAPRIRALVRPRQQRPVRGHRRRRARLRWRSRSAALPRISGATSTQPSATTAKRCGSRPIIRSRHTTLASCCISGDASSKRCRCCSDRRRACQRSRSSTTTWASHLPHPTATTKRSPRIAQRSSLKPDHATAWNNLGLALQAMNRVPEAIAAYRQALSVTPRFAHAHWNLALALLAQRRIRRRLARIRVAAAPSGARRTCARAAVCRAGMEATCATGRCC